MVLDGKKKYGWFEISATAACGDGLLLGFGNGALVAVDTSNSNATNKSQAGGTKVKNVIAQALHFTGPEDHAVDKLQIMYMESSSREARADKMQFTQNPAQVECLVVSLSGGRVNFHTWPDKNN